MDVSAKSAEKKRTKGKKLSTETADGGALQSSNQQISGEEDSDLWISGVREEGGGGGGDGNRNGGEDQGRKKKKKKQAAAKDIVGVAAESGSGFVRPSGLGAATNGRSWTISLAVAGSIIDNAQSLMLATSLAGQIARAAAVFCVDEVIVFDEADQSLGRPAGRSARWRDAESDSGGSFLARVLQYQETPQYLRKTLIPMHADLQYAGLLPPLDAPHHARAHQWLPYREGCVVGPAPEGRPGSSLVNVGLFKDVAIRQLIPAGLRVTVAMGEERDVSMAPDAILEAVSPCQPREKGGLYWGYSVRLTWGLSRVLSECPFEGGYDLSIGTSEHGHKVLGSELKLPKFKHLLLVFGGLAGLEESTELDDAIEIKDPSCLFHMYLNTCPSQGSRTIRTEEAILISMAHLQEGIGKAIAMETPSS